MRALKTSILEPVLLATQFFQLHTTVWTIRFIQPSQIYTVHNDAFFQKFYGATWIGKRRPFFYHFGIAYSPL